jgi:hypothetical protein
LSTQQVTGFEIEPDRIMWRYMRIDRLRSLLESSSVYFVSAREFDDQFESSVTAPEYKNRLRGFPHGSVDLDLFEPHVSKAFQELTRLTKVNCWHQNDGESAAMWKLYLPTGKGVAVRSTVGALMSSLREFRLKPEYEAETVHVGRVMYIDYRNALMPHDSMLGRFFYKRMSYAYEKEVRAVVSLRIAEECGVEVPEKGIFVEVDMTTLVHEIHVAPRPDDTLFDEVRRIVKKANLGVRVGRSEMDDPALI